MNNTPLINVKHVKDYTLAQGQLRAWKPTRVSGDFLLKVNSVARNFIVDYVKSHPSVGVTIK